MRLSDSASLQWMMDELTRRLPEWEVIDGRHDMRVRVQPGIGLVHPKWEGGVVIRPWGLGDHEVSLERRGQGPVSERLWAKLPGVREARGVALRSILVDAAVDFAKAAQAAWDEPNAERAIQVARAACHVPLKGEEG